MFLNVITVSENDEAISALDSEYIENDDFDMGEVKLYG